MKSSFTLRTLLMLCAGLACIAFGAESSAAESSPATANVLTRNEINSGDTAWMLISCGLVILMVPGLALFYGGMVRRKNILGTMMHSMVPLAIIGVMWVVVGYALAFGDSRNGWIGWNFQLVGLHDIIYQTAQGKWMHHTFGSTAIPVILHCMYQGMFAIITPALISGAFAERIRFGPYCLFILLWGLLVYCPLAHWVWAVDSAGNPAGWLGKLGALDYAGGTVVHITADISGLAAILILSKRVGYPEHAMHPNSMVLTLLGAGLLWFGWFGFNGGSALGSNGGAAGALGASQAAAASAALTWLLVEWKYRGKPTALGFASGLVSGLVAVTPASGFVNPLGAMVIGALASCFCYYAVCLKSRLKYDDSLDAFGVHGVGGLLGAVLTGVLASSSFYLAGGGTDAVIKTLTEHGRVAQIGVQILAAAVAAIFSFAMTVGLIKGIDAVFGFCLDPRSEIEGLDRAEHGEVGFDTHSALEMVLERRWAGHSNVPAPPEGLDQRFTIVLEGVDSPQLTTAWSSLCQAGDTPPPPAFQEVYPYMTTVQGNRFHFRGGDPRKLSGTLQTLLREGCCAECASRTASKSKEDEFRNVSELFGAGSDFPPVIPHGEAPRLAATRRVVVTETLRAENFAQTTTGRRQVRCHFIEFKIDILTFDGPFADLFGCEFLEKFASRPRPRPLQTPLRGVLEPFNLRELRGVRGVLVSSRDVLCRVALNRSEKP